jgi:hypothetical protein
MHPAIVTRAHGLISDRHEHRIATGERLRQDAGA